MRMEGKAGNIPIPYHLQYFAGDGAIARRATKLEEARKRAGSPK